MFHYLSYAEIAKRIGRTSASHDVEVDSLFQDLLGPDGVIEENLFTMLCLPLDLKINAGAQKTMQEKHDIFYRTFADLMPFYISTMKEHLSQTHPQDQEADRAALEALRLLAPSINQLFPRQDPLLIAQQKTKELFEALAFVRKNPRCWYDSRRLDITKYFADRKEIIFNSPPTETESPSINAIKPPDVTTERLPIRAMPRRGIEQPSVMPPPFNYLTLADIQAKILDKDQEHSGMMLGFFEQLLSENEEIEKLLKGYQEPEDVLAKDKKMHDVLFEDMYPQLIEAFQKKENTLMKNSAFFSTFKNLKDPYLNNCFHADQNCVSKISCFNELFKEIELHAENASKKVLEVKGHPAGIYTSIYTTTYPLRNALLLDALRLITSDNTVKFIESARTDLISTYEPVFNDAVDRILEALDTRPLSKQKTTKARFHAGSTATTASTTVSTPRPKPEKSLPVKQKAAEDLAYTGAKMPRRTLPTATTVSTTPPNAIGISSVVPPIAYAAYARAAKKSDATAKTMEPPENSPSPLRFHSTKRP